MENKKQSSIELFIEQLEEKSWENASMNRIEICMNVEEYLALKNQAKAMHKEEIEDTFQEGKWDWAEHITNGTESKDLAQYYNETFGGNK